MRSQVELWQDILNHKVAAVLSHVRVCELDVVFVPSFGHECQRNQLRVSVEPGELTV